MGKIKNLIKKLIWGRQTNESTIAKLRAAGVKVGENTHIYGIKDIDTKHGPLIEIGSNVTVSTNVTILAHDATTKKHFGYTKIRKVFIGNRVFVGSGSIVLPGAHIGEDCIIGAGAVVGGTIPPDSIVIGNPGQIIGKTSEYIEKNKKYLTEDNIYDDNSMEDMVRASLELDGKTGFVL